MANASPPAGGTAILQCTDYVREFVDVPWNGNASAWTTEARTHWGAQSISSTPVVGSIACYQPGQDGADWDGHVAIVVAVNGNVYTVSEMNRTGKSANEVIVGGGPQGGPGIVDTRQITFSPGVGAFLIPPAANVYATMSTLLGGNVGATTTSSNAPVGELTLAGTGAGLKAAVTTDATDSWGWVKAQALPIAVAGVMLWVLYGSGSKGKK